MDAGSLPVGLGGGGEANEIDRFIFLKNIKKPASNNIEAGFAFPAIKQPGDDTRPFYIMLGNYHPVYDL